MRGRTDPDGEGGRLSPPADVTFGPVSPDRPAVKYRLPRHELAFFPGPVGPESHPTAWTFPAWLRNERVPWLMTIEKLYGLPAAFPASVSPEAGLLLFSLVRNIRPRTVVEVGTFLGVSTIWMAAALEDIGDDPVVSGDAAGRVGHLHTIDTFEDLPESGWRTDAATGRAEAVDLHLAEAGVRGRVTVHTGRSWEVLRASRDGWREAGGVQLALLDGDHSAEGLRRDLIELEPALPTGGYVVVHDTSPERCGGHVGGRHLLEHINDFAAGLYEHIEIGLAPLNYGLGVFRRLG